PAGESARIGRRRFLGGFVAVGAAAAGLASLAAWHVWPEQGLWNPCRAALPPRLANHPLVDAAWDGIDASEFWDSHAHLMGTGDASSGIYVNPRMESVLNPTLYARRLFFLNGACVHEAPGSVDRSYVERLHNLAEGMRRGFKILLFAFERAHDE